MTESSNLPDKKLTSADETINLLRLAVVLAKHKKLVLGLPFAVALLAAGISLLLPNIYTGTAKILPPQQSQATSAVLSQLSSLAGLTGVAGAAGGLKNPNDLYVGMIKSRTVADNIILHFDLNEVYDQEIQARTRKRLESLTTVTAGKDGIITIEVEDKDPKRAADMANAYIDELLKLTKVLAVTEASQRRLFFEQQTIQAKDNLVKAEVAVKRALEQGGLVGVEAEGRSVLEAAALLRAQILVKELQIGYMRTYASEANPKLKREKQELELMKLELAKSEGVGGRTAAPRVGAEAGIDNLGLLRNVMYYEALYGMLLRQLETAKLDEAKDSAIIQVMDKAIAPELKSGPIRSLIVLLSALAALVISVLWAFVRESMAKVDPQQASLLLDLKRYLAWK